MIWLSCFGGLCEQPSSRVAGAFFLPLIGRAALTLPPGPASWALIVGAPELIAVEALIRHYRLAPHPEGGWYRELHRSPASVSRADGQRRPGLTTILFLLPQGEISRWHRVSRADESWHHAGGAPLELLCLPPEGGALQRQRLSALMPSPVNPVDPPAMPLAVVPAGWWQAARSLGDWSLVSCCVGPGFDFADFTLLRDLPAAQHPAGVLAEFL